MALTTRVISWTVDNVKNATESGSITITPSVAQIVDTVDNIVYDQTTLTYSLAVGQTDALICTDNTGTNPSASNWGYNILIQLSPGAATISVQNASLPTGGGSYSLATILNAAGL